MTKWTALLAVLCLILCMPPCAFAEEGESEFVSPTRDPGAPTYDKANPGALVDSQLVARSYILIERSSGDVLLQRNADLQLYPASTTKIMTALIALQVAGDDFDNPEAVLEISERANDLPEGSSRVPFKTGEIVTFKDAMYGLLLKSGNEAANAIAEYISGDILTFVRQMNETAAMLGLTNTHFVNPHGLHDDIHQTTARELAHILDVAMNNDTFRQIVGTYTWDLSATPKPVDNPARKIFNTNLHLNPDPDNNYTYLTSKGGKTGFTSQAGYVLAEMAEKDGVELIAVVMYSGKYSHWRDTEWLFEYGFSLYDSITAEEIYAENPTEIHINGFALDDINRGDMRLSIRAVDAKRVVRFVDYKEEIRSLVDNYSNYTNIAYITEPRAPITAGQVMAILTFYPPNEEPADYELIASRSVAERLDAPPSLDDIVQRVEDDPSIFPPFSWDWVLPPLLGAAVGIWLLRTVFRALLRRRRRKKRIPTPKGRTYT